MAVLYLTVFAAFRLYQFLPAGAAFVALGLICAFAAVIAVAQNAMVMAFIGFAGGFAAPILVSTGQGNHVALFSYYLLLGVAIAAVAWVKAWRALNLLGFFATFGVATLWGVLKYRPEHFDTTEPFLIAFFLVYLVASLLYATASCAGAQARHRRDADFRHADRRLRPAGRSGARRSSTAAAFSSLALGALYLALGWWMLATPPAPAAARCIAGWPNASPPSAWASSRWPCRWHWTRAGPRRSGRSKARPCSGWAGARTAGWRAQPGLPCRCFAASPSWNRSSTGASRGQWPLANPDFIGGTMLALAALAIAWWSREPATDGGRGNSKAHSPGSSMACRRSCSGSVSCGWQYALNSEIERAPLDRARHRGAGLRRGGTLAPAPAGLGRQRICVALSWRCRQRRGPWPIAATPAWTVLPMMVLGALAGVADLEPRVPVLGLDRLAAGCWRCMS